MNYEKIYNNLCKSRKFRGVETEVGYEVHHIKPRSFGGSDSKSNLVKLTYREHFIAHKLLVKINNGSKKYKMIYALRLLSGKNKFLSSREYSRLRGLEYESCFLNGVYFINPAVLPKDLLYGSNPLEEVILRLHMLDIDKFFIPKEKRFYHQGTFYKYDKYLKNLRDMNFVSSQRYSKYAIYTINPEWELLKSLKGVSIGERSIDFDDKQFGFVKGLRKGYCIFNNEKFLNPMRPRSKISLENLSNSAGVRDSLPVKEPELCVVTYESDEVSLLEDDFKSYLSLQRYSRKKFNSYLLSFEFICNQRLIFSLEKNGSYRGMSVTIKKKCVKYFCEKYNYVYESGGDREGDIIVKSLMIPRERIENQCFNHSNLYDGVDIIGLRD